MSWWDDFVFQDSEVHETWNRNSSFKYVFPSCQDRKTNSFVRFLGEVMSQQICFEIYWPLNLMSLNRDCTVLIFLNCFRMFSFLQKMHKQTLQQNDFFTACEGQMTYSKYSFSNKMTLYELIHGWF